MLSRAKVNNIERRLYETVATLSTVEKDYIPAEDEKVKLAEMGGDSADDPNAYVCITWDAGSPNEEILFVTYQDAVVGSVKELVGDGVKILRVFLSNNSTSGLLIGAYWLGESDGE